MARPIFDRLPSPRGRGTAILLAISITLNLFFVGGFLYRRGVADGRQALAAARTQSVAERLQLDDSQRERFAALRRDMLDRQRSANRAIRSLVDDMWEEVTKKSPDTAQVDSLVARIMTERTALQRDQMRLIIDFVPILSPEQKQEFVAMARALNDLLQRPVPPTRQAP